MTYRAELEGFTGNFNTVAELKAWAEALIRRHAGMHGKGCRIYKASWVAKDGSCAQYGGLTREVVVGA